MSDERTCHACGRHCEPDPYQPPWCGRCTGMQYAENLEDRFEQSDDAMTRLKSRQFFSRCRRAEAKQRHEQTRNST